MFTSLVPIILIFITQRTTCAIKYFRMEGETVSSNQTEAEHRDNVHRGVYKDKGIAVFTSGGDAQGKYL